MPLRFLTAPLIAMIALPLASAQAESISNPNISFCNPGDKCMTLVLQNRAYATVTAINITQHPDGNSCADVKKTINANLAGGAQADNAFAGLNRACKYKVKYVTTSGCTGNKTTHVGPDINPDRTTRLKGGCGTLKVVKLNTIGDGGGGPD